MGNAQSNQQGPSSANKTTLIRNDSSLEFDPGKKIKTDRDEYYSSKDSYDSECEYLS